MALIRDSSGRPTGSVTTTEAQAAHKERWDAKQVRKAKTVQNNKTLRSQRTPQQQLKVLDERLGVGIGAARERDRLKKE